MATLLDGKKVAAGIRSQTAGLVESLADPAPTLAIVTATQDESSAWYVRSLMRSAGKLGLATRLVHLEASATEDAIGAALRDLADDDSVHGVILQTPLPEGVRPDALLSLIPVAKDVDGVNPLSAGRVLTGLPAFAPATAAAVMEILRAYSVPLRGARAVVVGRSMVVGKPVAHLLLAADATVTICHSKTVDLARVTRQADVLVAAIGRPRLITAEAVKEGAVVVDVGTTPDENGTLAGDVDGASVEPVAGALSPVPGGVGPVTTAVLLRNTVTAARSPRPAHD
jgi:methylenetetrahydrofolate dehydrogenase (NADP+) / methenyltetrahydrofolate cyclohydrolase